MLTILGNAGTRTDRVLWVAEECGLEHTHEPVDFRAGAHRTPEFLAINPNAKVPALVHDGLTLFESAAIGMYLAERDPEQRLLPADPADRARHLQWLVWVVTELEQPAWTKAKHTFALPREVRTDAVRPAIDLEWRRHTAVLADALADRPHLLGDQVTVADLFAAHTLVWGRLAKLPMEHDVLDAYAQRLMARPSWARVMARRG